MTRPRVAAIVPAYNEAKTIGKVLEVLCASKVLDEVIVVSDGSADDTAKVAQRSGAMVLKLDKNIGKGPAMRRGVSQTQASIIAFFDADIIGLKSKHVEKLIKPVLQGRVDMNIGLNDRGPFVLGLMRHLPLISGQRALRRELFEQIPLDFLRGYKVETSLNYFTKARGARLGIIAMYGVSIRKKYQKVGVLKSLGQYLSMTREIVSAMINVRLAHRLNYIRIPRLRSA